MPQIVLVSRELGSLGGGGIGIAVAGFAGALSSVADVTVLTSSRHEDRYRQLQGVGATGLPPEVRVEFIPEPTPDEAKNYFDMLHAYSSRAYDRIRELFPGAGPDLVEFPDYQAEGIVTVQARQAHAAALRNTTVCVRLHTSIEICSVLNGYLNPAFATRAVFAAERQALRGADRIITPGGDVFPTYRRFYGSRALAEPVQIRGLIASLEPTDETTGVPPVEEALDMLYLGRLERRKGVQDLVRATTALSQHDWRLTLVGGDTETAPLGFSMREQLELMAAGDSRIRFVGEASRDELARLVHSHHLLVCPSRWECWPSVVLEALSRGRPVLGTPTGGMVEMLGIPGSGWLTDGCGAMPLADAIDERIDARSELPSLLAGRGPESAYGELTDPEPFQRRYLELAALGATPPTPRAGSRTRDKLVSVIIPYFHLHEFVEETVASVFQQDYSPIEVILVNDGSLDPSDAVLLELATRYPIRVLTTTNSGLGSARNAGIRQCRGDYVLPLDADNMLAPGFVRRCVELLEREPSVAFVTTWSQYVNEDGAPLGPYEGYQPFGNTEDLVLEGNVAGDAAGMLRRRIFELGYSYNPDLTSWEDWELYRELHAAGLYGRVIPERLLLYRVRADSMVRQIGNPRSGRLAGELAASLREKQVQWESLSD